MTEIIPFEFPITGQPVRTLTINGSPWFVGKDVTDVLGYANGRDAITNLPERMRNTVAISDGTPGNPNRKVVNEPGVYRLVMRSNLPAAEAFQDWIAEEVVPSIRKTGSYSLPGSGIAPITLTFSEAATLIRQHWGLSLGSITLRKVLRSAGVLKQGSCEPKRAYEEWFWLTDSSYLIYPHALPLLVRKIDQNRAQLRRNPFVQTRLDIDGSERELLAG